MKKLRKIIAAIIALVLVLCMKFENPYDCNAATGTFTLLNSDDVFTGDANFMTTIASKLSAVGYYTYETSRPSSVYAMNTHLQNSKAVYIRAHGISSGSCIVLDSSAGRYYYATNVPTSLNNSFVFISICSGATTNSLYGNLCSTLINAGVTCAISYSDTVYVYQARNLEENFYECATTNNLTILTSYAQAVTANNTLYGSNTASTSCCIFGNPSGVLH